MTSPHSFQIAPVTGAFAAFLLRADQTAEARDRAIRIVERVLPLLPAGIPDFDDLGDFFDRSRRIGNRQALYAAIYPRLLAKVQARGAISLRADVELSLSSASEGVVLGRAA